MKFSYFISAHGFGHAARSCACMTAIESFLPGVEFEIYSAVPEWFFAESLHITYTLHPVQVDVGLVQLSPLKEDLHATLERLDHFLPFDPQLVSDLSSSVAKAECKLLISDISPLGLEVATHAGVPSILIENFTWDWIYEGYLEKEPGFQKFIDQLRTITSQANYQIQASPACDPARNGALVTSPISRNPQSSRDEIRKQLKIGSEEFVLLISMGGIPEGFTFLNQLKKYKDFRFVIPGGSSTYEMDKNLILLPHHSSFYHPDLMNACDAVIGKAGYSTIAEAYWNGVPFAFVSRPTFRESKSLGEFILNNMQGFEIKDTDFASLQWMERISELAKLPRIRRSGLNGSAQVAQFIKSITLDLLQP